MDTRRAAVAAVVVCGLVAGTALLAGFAIATEPEPAVVDRATARASAQPAANATALACPPRAGDANVSTASAPTEPRIAGLYPNPTTDGNVGEFVVLETPPETRLENVTLTDGHTTATLPNETVSGRVAVSTAPNVTQTLTDAPVLELEGHLQLATDGDDLRLRNATATIDSVAYERAPTAEQWYRTASDGDERPTQGQWWPRDATCLPVSSSEIDDATAFVLPDEPEVPRETIRNADDRLLLAGYTVTSDAIAADLVAAAERGVDVRVLLEASPVGGTPAPTEGVIETLEAGGVEVRAIGGEAARYRYHHPKYAVADDRVLVTSENWKPSGVGGESSRGWGVRLADETLAADLAAVFRADFEGRDTVSGDTYRTTTSFVEEDSQDFAATDSSAEFPTNHEAATIPVESAELLLAPDNADRRLQELLAGADDEILVIQPSIAADVSVLEETLAAARRGVDVRILLGSTWYNADENEALAADLERVAEQEDIPLEVRLVEDTDRFEKIHAKGVVIDREIAVVGSANWNGNSLENNREVLVALHGDEVAGYYADVFDADWSGDSWSFPVGLAVAVAVALAAAALIGRRYIRFGDRPEVGDIDPVEPGSGNEK
ncbi:phospholipase D-like domain-containing protein [Natrinema versiforme]|uniref:Phospholipase D/Transphosphatidylase n=1 Tax=Natrinema versiforme JCM 10478 TaxID=1227496 RepID=L9Y8Y4_9EURY|nr:phospholipase D-like domain-containing protein [Natrinema versiforme]ELY70136.1 phospholipase D/Transphosphatidylase [Natrinema versiforme JCM 10478]